MRIGLSASVPDRVSGQGVFNVTSGGDFREAPKIRADLLSPDPFSRGVCGSAGVGLVVLHRST